MDLAFAPWLTVLAPALMVFGVVGLLPGVVPMDRPWARMMIVGVIAVAVLRYLYWRVTETVIQDAGLLTVWSWSCLVIELMATWDGLLLFMALLRSSDRSAEADRGEAVVRGLDAGAAPRVDVLIATYNEPLAVLEKTIVGALSLEWPNIAIYVLDDGRRPWLRDFCLEKGVGYVTRPDNKGAKAGNLNHALKLTDGDFVAVFDADFVPQRNFLMRVMGLFSDPKVGIVQTPHAFYNHDPMQTNLGMRKSLPDDQRFFFEAIMPSRDGWNAAFCCGSNSVIRRSALDLAGGALPEGSITEDMLLSLVMLRQGFITRFLGERLAYGLAPETVSAFFVQRQRWARGAIQILFLRAGPLGPGLRLAHRLLFLPTHWLTHSLMTLVALVVPLVFLLTGVPPMTQVTLETALFYLAPMLIAIFGGLLAFGRGKYHPLAAQVLGTFQAFKLLPTILVTLVKPHGHAFRVTPKGAEASGAYERTIFLASVGLIVLTVAGLAVNLAPEWRRLDDVSLLPLVAFWCALNLVVLFLVSLLCLQMPLRRQEERFSVTEPVMLRHRETGAFATMVSADMSLSGIGLEPAGALDPWRQGDKVQAYLSQVGWIPARVARVTPSLLGLEFEHSGLIERDLLIRKLFTGGQNTAADGASTWRVTAGLLKRIWTADMRVRIPPQPEQLPVSAPVPAAGPDRLPAASLLLPPSERAAALAQALRSLDRAA